MWKIFRRFHRRLKFDHFRESKCLYSIRSIVFQRPWCSKFDKMTRKNRTVCFKQSLQRGDFNLRDQTRLCRVKNFSSIPQTSKVRSFSRIEASLLYQFWSIVLRHWLQCTRFTITIRCGFDERITSNCRGIVESFPPLPLESSAKWCKNDGNTITAGKRITKEGCNVVTA